MIELRPYQSELLDKVRSHLKAGCRRVLLQAPTGAGKTAIASSMAAGAIGKGKRVFMLCHRRELVRQCSRAFSNVNITHGIVSAGFEQNRYLAAQVCSIPTLANRLDMHQAPDVVIFDECHHISAGSWSKIAKAFPNAVHIGLSATPMRLDGQGMGDFFDEIVIGPTVSWLIENGSLAPYRLMAPVNNVDLGAVHRVAGDYNKRELDAAVAASTITGDAVLHYQKHAMNTKALMFCVSVKRSLEAVEQFRSAGIEADHVDGETDPDVRDATIDRFEHGDLMVLSNVQIFGEGADIAGCQTLIDCAPSMSLGSVMQRWGRVLRPAPGKTALILDHAGNSGHDKHGFPDTERVWTLDGREGRRKKSPDEVLIRKCPMCFSTMLIYKRSCAACGHQFVTEGREIEEIAGELVEVDPKIARQMQLHEQGRAQTEEELVAIGRARGHKRPEAWARHVLIARRAKEKRA